VPYYQRAGTLPQKHFTTLRSNDGAMYHEELFTSLGFAAETALLYRLRSPSSAISITAADRLELVKDDAASLQNFQFELDGYRGKGDYVESRRPIFFNSDIVFSIATPDRSMEGFYRNGWTDELVLVLEGSGTVESPFGSLRYGPLDFVHVPRSVTVRWDHDDARHTLAVVESAQPITLPRHFYSPAGQLRESAPFHERDLRAPVLGEPVDETGEFLIVVKTGEQLTHLVLDHHPFDVVGWDGCFYPFAVNMADLEPISGRTDRMPDQYQLFDAGAAYVVAITPKRSPDHPEAAPAQPHHMNVDYDEIMLRITGSNRPNDPAGGTLTLHPRGLSHGPRVGFQNQKRLAFEPLWALMVDTRDHLSVAVGAAAGLDSASGSKWRDE
jgi:homogentisate 1,2-dioxygenase